MEMVKSGEAEIERLKGLLFEREGELKHANEELDKLSDHQVIAEELA